MPLLLSIAIFFCFFTVNLCRASVRLYSNRCTEFCTRSWSVVPSLSINRRTFSTRLPSLITAQGNIYSTDDLPASVCAICSGCSPLFIRFCIAASALGSSSSGLTKFTIKWSLAAVYSSNSCIASVCSFLNSVGILPFSSTSITKGCCIWLRVLRVVSDRV